MSGSIAPLSTSFLVLIFPCDSAAQGVAYHLHKDTSQAQPQSSMLQLKTAGPDSTTAAVRSANNLKGLPAGEQLVRESETQASVPGAAGIMPSGSTVTFTLWMRKTSASGTMYPRAKLALISNGTVGRVFCVVRGAAALTSTLTKYTLTATTTSNVTLATSDRFYLWVGVNQTAAPTTNTYAEVNVEGTLNGNYDSQVVIPAVIPPPAISGLSPAAAPVGTSVTVTGSNFGPVATDNKVRFNLTRTDAQSSVATSLVSGAPGGCRRGRCCSLRTRRSCGCSRRCAARGHLAASRLRCRSRAGTRAGCSAGR